VALSSHRSDWPEGHFGLGGRVLVMLSSVVLGERLQPPPLVLGLGHPWFVATSGHPVPWLAVGFVSCLLAMPSCLRTVEFYCGS
jgi:hypothetical protein